VTLKRVLRVPDGRGDALRLFHGVADGLLAGDVLAGLKGNDALLGVKASRCQELHRVHVRVLQDLVVAGVYAWRDAPLRCSALGPLSHRIA